MLNSRTQSDSAVLVDLGQRLARLRLDRNLSQDDLAREAGLSKRTLHRMEHGHSAQMTNWIRVQRALDLLGNFEQFLPAPAPSPMQQLKLQGRLRQRASSSSSSSSVAPAQQPDRKPKSWTWGDES